MKNVVISGSSRGIGLGLAKEFLSLGHSVTISGRNKDSLQEAIRELNPGYEAPILDYQVCDVRNEEEIEALWSKASQFGKVDIWINNAGTGQMTDPVSELDPEAINHIVDTNIKGLIQCCRVAMKHMIVQGSGAIYNMEGFGSDGRKMKNMTVYGTSKSAVRYFSKSLALEAKDTPVIIGTISPGMVVTELLTGPVSDGSEMSREALRIFHILADHVETVSPFLVKEMLNNERNGKAINWLSGKKVMWRFLRNLFIKRKLDGLPPMT